MLAKNLKSLIELKEITVSELARRTEVPKSNILTWLSGANPNLDQLNKVAQYFSVSVDYLAFGRTEEDLLSKFTESIEVHSGHYEITIKKVAKKFSSN
jgi:transcriptional regulator with XRE-family HTH domain